MRDNRPRPEKNYRYYEQQNTLDIIAHKLGVAAFRPDYHNANGDCNTVLFYTLEDYKHNRAVDRQPTRYTRSDASCRPYFIDDKYIYRDHFWAFENTDLNGTMSYRFANFGKLELGHPKWREQLEGDIRIALAKKKQNDIIRSYGSCANVPEACEEYNDTNRDLVEAYLLRYGRVFYGSTNLHTSSAENEKENARRILQEWKQGDKFYNFQGSFLVPVQDSEVEKLVHDWRETAKMSVLEDLGERIKKLGGTTLIWY